MFKRHSENKPLIEQLEKAKKARNYIAHRVIEKYSASPQETTAGRQRNLKRPEDT